MGAIAPGSLRRGLDLSITAGSLGMVWFAVALNMPFVMLLEALGASGVLLGISSTIRQIAILGQIPGSFLMERLPHRKQAWAILACIHRGLLLVPAWLAWSRPQGDDTILLILVAVGLSFVIESMAAPAWHSWMADLIPEALRGRFWSRRQAYVTVSFLLAIGGSGWLLDVFRRNPAAELNGFALLLTLAALFGIADILLHTGVPEPARRPALPGRGWLTRIVTPLRHRNFRNLALGMGIWMFAITMAGTFNAVYLKRVFDVSYTGLSLMTICGSISTICASFFVGYLIERVGARTFAVTMMCVAPLFCLPWFFVTGRVVTLNLPFLGTVPVVQALLLMCVATFVFSGMYAAVGICHLSLLGTLAPRRERTLAMAVHWCLVGLCTAGGPLLGGLIVDWFATHPSRLRLFGGTRFDFIQMLHALHAIVIWTLAVPFMLRVRARGEPLNVAAAFERVVLVNPLRFASGLYHAQVLGAPAARKRRLRAAEAIGIVGAEIATADLVARLDDPVVDVREAAAIALGRIGGREAHAALWRRIEDPDNDLTLPALRALRLAPSERLTPRLLPMLRHPEPLVVREVVRTLGACRGDEAIAPLIDLLHRTPGGPLVAITAEILGHFGDISALYEILPRLRTASSPFMRRALAAACGDLLGQPDGFYKLLVREERALGAGVSRLLRRARRFLWRSNRNLDRAHRRALRSGLTRIEGAYEAMELPEAARAAYELARLLARCRYGVVPADDIAVFLHDLDRRDPRYTVGAWYLAILNGDFAHLDASGSLAPVRDALEIMLAVHLVASWILDERSSEGPRRRGILSLTHFQPPREAAKP